MFAAQQGLVLNTSFSYTRIKPFQPTHPGQPCLTLCCVAEQSGCRNAFWLRIPPNHLVEDTIPFIALQYDWHYGRNGFAAVKPLTPYKEKENQARGQLTVSGGATTPSSEWSSRVPNPDNLIFFSFPSSLALVRFSLTPLLQCKHRQFARCVSPWATSDWGGPRMQPVHPRAGSDCLPMETHS